MTNPPPDPAPTAAGETDPAPGGPPPPAAERHAVRVIALDPDHRVLLVRYDGPDGSCWATPGGGLEPGEDHRAAAIRELAEELGIRGAALGVTVAVNVWSPLFLGPGGRQVERYLTTRLPPDAVHTDQATAPDASARGWRWWTRDELRATAETVFPRHLADLIDLHLTGTLPATPIDLTSWAGSSS